MRWMIPGTFLLYLCGCFFSRGYGDSELTRSAVVRLAGEYIEHVLKKNVNQLDGLVLWSDYAENKNQTVNRTLYFKQLAALPPFSTGPSNPLVGLDVHELDVDGDNARVVLTKHGLADPPEIEVELTWVGQGWLVVNDSLFGPDQLLEKFAKENQYG